MVAAAASHSQGWRVFAPNHPPVQVEASNWLAALGEGLQALGVLDQLARIACERLANGKVLVNDLRGSRYVVEPIVPSA